ncbi:hypothetical protein GCM10017600_84490 [Streptosporangium carneum]|uniref:Ricin B lectin domain-containing protein n=1 Tax=Streptosporangium carneum TaxID=47481 RepID=A0A9W6IBK0_9ACTN|nr:hypothetical protein GCM10017600_84490 [Streptosporangium carneum]
MKPHLRRTVRALLAVTLTALAVVSALVATPAAPASAARSPEQIVRDCYNPKWRQAGDLVYAVPECRITVKSGERVYGSPEIEGSPSVMCNGKGGSTTINGSSTTSTSFSFGLDLGAKKKFGDLEGQIGAKLGWSWSWSQSRGWATTVTIPGWGVGWVGLQKALRKVVVDVVADYDDGRGYSEKARDQVVYGPDPDSKDKPVGKSRLLTDWEIAHYCRSLASSSADEAKAKSLPAPADTATPASDGASTAPASDGAPAAPATEAAVSAAAPASAASGVSAQAVYGPDFRFWAVTQGGLLNSYSNNCMTVKGGSSANGAAIVQEDCNPKGLKEQRWSPTRQSNGYFIYQNAKNQKCLDVSGSETASGQPLEQYSCLPKEAVQNWNIVPVTLKLPPYDDSQPGYFFSNKKSGKCIALDWGSLLQDGGRVVQQNCP